MGQLSELITKEKQQYLAYLAVSIAILVLAGIGYSVNPLLYQRFLGYTNPLVDFVLTILLGALFLSILLSRGGFAIFAPEHLRKAAPFFALAPAFALISIAVDLKVRFPADLNVAFPESLIFYPTIGFGVEVLFHVVPLGVLVLALTSLPKGMDKNTGIWIAIVLVAVLEPVFQTAIGGATPFPLWATALVALNIFALNLAQLSIFKRADLISMYAFRLAYYAIWHILWGYVRLRVLF